MKAYTDHLHVQIYVDYNSQGHSGAHKSATPSKEDIILAMVQVGLEARGASQEQYEEFNMLTAIANRLCICQRLQHATFGAIASLKLYDSRVFGIDRVILLVGC